MANIHRIDAEVAVAKDHGVRAGHDYDQGRQAEIGAQQELLEFARGEQRRSVLDSDGGGEVRPFMFDAQPIPHRLACMSGDSSKVGKRPGSGQSDTALVSPASCSTHSPSARPVEQLHPVDSGRLQGQKPGLPGVALGIEADPQGPAVDAMAGPGFAHGPGQTVAHGFHLVGRPDGPGIDPVVAAPLQRHLMHLGPQDDGVLGARGAQAQQPKHHYHRQATRLF